MAFFDRLRDGLTLLALDPQVTFETDLAPEQIRERLDALVRRTGETGTWSLAREASPTALDLHFEGSAASGVRVRGSMQQIERGTRVRVRVAMDPMARYVTLVSLPLGTTCGVCLLAGSPWATAALVGLVVALVVATALAHGTSLHAARTELLDACEAGVRARGEGAYRTARVRVEPTEDAPAEEELQPEPRRRTSDHWDPSEL